MRGEPNGATKESVADEVKRIKSVTLGIAAGIIAGGGPHPGNHLEEGFVGLAEVAGNSDSEIVAATKEKIFKLRIENPSEPIL